MTDSGIRTVLVEPPTVKVADLTGPDTSSGSFGVGGTDLGDTFDDARVGGRLYLEHHRRVELAVPPMQYRHDTTARL